MDREWFSTIRVGAWLRCHYDRQPTPAARDWARIVPNERSDIWTDKIAPVHCSVLPFTHHHLKEVFCRR